MKISLKWLNDYVDVRDFLEKPEQLANHLTQVGLEVEEIFSKGSDFKCVVIGQILKKDKHPNADKLSLCQVTTGGGVVHQIVCGAKNHNENDKVVVALPGAVLPGGFAIQKASLRGVESSGMLCSLKELGLPPEGDGIVILPEDAPLGEGFAEYKGLDDVVFEIKVTPNRSDCLSHYGLAREIGTVLSRPVQFKDPEFPIGEKSTRDMVGLKLVEAQLCPRYAGRYVSEVKVGPSPDWMQMRLESVGINPINNVVDITNYVMMELGQPLHAFDVRFIEDKQIIIDRAHAGEKFVTLDGTELTLAGDELTIRDSKKAVALAGIVGGKNSGILPDTTEVFIESAYFSQQCVRRTSRKYGIETDSAYRFARGVDPSGTLRAMNRCAQLLVEHASGKAYGDFYDEYPAPIQREAILISLADVEARLGYAIEAPTFENYMLRLGCTIEKTGGGSYQVVPPAFRVDLNMPVDLVEEFGRLNGYDKIPEVLPVMDLHPTVHSADYIFNNRLLDIMSAAGFCQAVNYLFIGADFQRKIIGSLPAFRQTGLGIGDEPVMILNPLNEEINSMNMSLVPGLYKNLVHNYRYGSTSGRLCESALVFAKKENQYEQSPRLGLLLWGQDQAGLWQKNSVSPVFFAMKAAVEHLLASLHIHSYEWIKPEQTPEFLHGGQSAVLICEGKRAGFIGVFHPLLLAELKMREEAAVAELDIEILRQRQPRIDKIRRISKFPQVERDLAFMMPQQLGAGEVKKEMEKLGGALLRGVEIFDVYQGSSLPEGQKSVAFRLFFQDSEGTLSENQILDQVQRVTQGVEEKFSIQVR